MPTDSLTFPLEKVKAFKAYFTHCRSAARGKPEFNDLDTTVKLCEQLIAVMSQGQPPRGKAAKKSPGESAEKA